MLTDIHGTRKFYASPQGAVAARMLRERLALMWPSLPGQSVLGVGHTGPYLRLWREEAARCVALTPGPADVRPWPRGVPNLACMAEEDALPFADLSFDRILLVHGIEAAENTRRLLRELWRVLKDDGRLIVVAPNRRGMWAHVESTPFGQGQPFSPGQISRLLRAAMFRIERRDTALYMPPWRLRLVLRGAPLWERAGRRVAHGLAGVTLSEAVKDLYAAMPSHAVQRRRVVLVEAA